MAFLKTRKDGRIDKKILGCSCNTWTNIFWIETWSWTENATTKWTMCCCQPDYPSANKITKFSSIYSKSFLSPHLFHYLNQLKLQLLAYGHQWPPHLHHFMLAAVNAYLLKRQKIILNCILRVISLRKLVVVIGNVTKIITKPDTWLVRLYGIRS